MFVLALVHTFPFIIYHIWYGDMVKKWKTDVVYWTGVVALIFQAYLTAMSCSPIRYAPTFAKPTRHRKTAKS